MKRADVEVAAAAGLAAVFPLYQVFILPEICESPKLTPVEAVALLAAFASYLSVPLLSGPRRRQRFVWLRTPVMGSMLTAVALYHLVILKDWGPVQFALVWLALSVWTLPFAVVVHYSGMIVRGIRRRHGRPKEL